MASQLRLKQIMLVVSLMLSGALHAMDSTAANHLNATSKKPVIVNSEQIAEGYGRIDAAGFLKPTPKGTEVVVEVPTLPTPGVVKAPTLRQSAGKVDALFPHLTAKIAKATGAVSEEVIDATEATGVVRQETLETATPSNSWVHSAWDYLTGETARQVTEKKAAQVAERQALIAQRSAEAMAAVKVRVAVEAQAAAEAVEFAEQQEVLRQLQESDAAKLAAENAQRAADEVANSYAKRAFSAAASMKDSVLNRAASLKDSAMDAAGNSWTSTKETIVANPGTTAAVVIAAAAAAGSAWYVYNNGLPFGIRVLSDRALYGRELTTVEYITFVDKLGKQDIAELEKGDKANAVSAISMLKVPRVDGSLKTLIEEIKTQLNNLYVAKNVNDYNTALAEALNRLEEAAKPVVQDVPATTTTVTAKARAAANAVWSYFASKPAVKSAETAATVNTDAQVAAVIAQQEPANIVVAPVTVEMQTAVVIQQPTTETAPVAEVATPVVRKATRSVRATRPTSKFKAIEVPNIDTDFIMQSIDNQRVLIALTFTNCTFNNSAEDYKKANEMLVDILNNAIADAKDATREQELQALKTACEAAYEADLAALEEYNATK
jgi:hypothetical protein